MLIFVLNDIQLLTMKILSQGILLTALNNLIEECNRKQIVGDTADALSVGLGFKSFQNFVETKYFSGKSIPNIKTVPIIRYRDIEDKISEATSSKVANEEQIIHINTQLPTNDKRESIRRKPTKETPDKTLKPLDKIPGYELL